MLVMELSREIGGGGNALYDDRRTDILGLARGRWSAEGELLSSSCCGWTARRGGDCRGGGMEDNCTCHLFFFSSFLFSSSFSFSLSFFYKLKTRPDLSLFRVSPFSLSSFLLVLRLRRSPCSRSKQTIGTSSLPDGGKRESGRHTRSTGGGGGAFTEDTRSYSSQRQHSTVN